MPAIIQTLGKAGLITRATRTLSESPTSTSVVVHGQQTSNESMSQSNGNPKEGEEPGVPVLFLPVIVFALVFIMLWQVTQHATTRTVQLLVELFSLALTCMADKRTHYRMLSVKHCFRYCCRNQTETPNRETSRLPSLRRALKPSYWHSLRRPRMPSSQLGC